MLSVSDFFAKASKMKLNFPIFAVSFSSKIITLQNGL